ncbi:thyroid adenoma-associated protein homolog [Bombyx mandarina]|uniref:tRNA (32-2'-O)-methyltransferase regulator THADA n=1 Tax=Bombyx mandarina TaxID=7092 RepID=A0A6J2JAI1_BOMMA|nr:thyroid adenoma-associated protein homolog [Bombyx mandarina]
MSYNNIFYLQIIHPVISDANLGELLSDEASQLALYSAIATVVSPEDLEKQIVDNTPAIIQLINSVLLIGERSSSESSFTLSVTRTVLQISKMLDKINSDELGQEMMESLFVFTWSHLEHFVDSVRHLSAQIMACLVKYSVRMNKQGNTKALANLIEAIKSVDRDRKSFYLCLTSLIAELGADGVMARLSGVIPDTVNALGSQAIRASATIALESLLQKHAQGSTTCDLHEHWVRPILSYASNNDTDSAILNILEGLLAKAIKLDENLMNYIIPYIEESENSSADLKCVLMLLSAARGAGGGAGGGARWRGAAPYLLLERAAVSAADETRILALSLVVESPKSTEPFTPEELSFILHYLKYNINAQAPSFRQLTLSVMKKFMKRLGDSYGALRRRRHALCAHYAAFLPELTQLCGRSLLPGANYSRRCVALQILVWADAVYPADCPRSWEPEFVEKLLLHLDDSYESNKAMALSILEKCPPEILKDNSYSTSLKLSDILAQASSPKPTDCVSAAYKMDLLRKKLPENIVQDETFRGPEPVTFALVQGVAREARARVAGCARGVREGSRRPPYGALRCLRHLLTALDPQAISEDERWRLLMGDIINICFEASEAVACVVNNSSPEGHLPMDMSGAVVTEQGDGGGAAPGGEGHVTAQMVLLCAWRSVKEASLLLGTMASRLTVRGEGGEGRGGGSLTPRQLLAAGEHFTALLAQTKHRGAFEQAYVGFTQLLARLWRCRNPALHELPRGWLAALMQTIAADDKRALCATRRSAGLPFMIQALVTTELQVLGNPKCFHQCMSRLLQLAASSADLETRTHCINILRALYRNSALHETVAGYVSEGLVVALDGFDGATWTERNSSTLLFSALMVRTFGVQRTPRGEELCVRNRMTGRIFFLRYPKLYDYMLEKLNKVSTAEDAQKLTPSLYPVLLLLARLYPSALEGTVSNLKLSAFAPAVRVCAGAGALWTRAALGGRGAGAGGAARALAELGDRTVNMNRTHGTILQLITIFETKPDKLLNSEATKELSGSLTASLWVLRQAVGSPAPCYVVADDYTKLINRIVMNFPSLLDDATVTVIMDLLSKLIFDKNISKITFGREVCLANATYLHFVLLNIFETDLIVDFVFKTLQHPDYEVHISVLDYILILLNDLEIDNDFHENLYKIKCDETLNALRQNEGYKDLLCRVYENTEYLECKQKCLKILILERDTQLYVIRGKIKENLEVNDRLIVDALMKCIQDEHENFSHLYMKSLVDYVTKNLETMSSDLVLDVIRDLFSYSTADNSDAVREVVVEFMEGNFGRLLKSDLQGLDEAEKFEYLATLLCTALVTLEDDSDTLRQRTANLLLPELNAPSNVMPSKCAELFRDFIGSFSDCVPLYVLLALLDFNSEVCLTDEGNDECRVFDQNERYNIFLEETIWTSECADRIARRCSGKRDVLNHVLDIIENPVYKGTFDKLASNNIDFLKKSIVGDCDGDGTEIINPKIKIFVNKLKHSSI